MAGKNKDGESTPPQSALERYLSKQREAGKTEPPAQPAKRKFLNSDPSASAQHLEAPAPIAEAKPIADRGLDKVAVESRAFRDFSKTEQVRVASEPGRFWSRVAATIIDGIFVETIVHVLTFGLSFGPGIFPFSFPQNLTSPLVLIVSFCYYGWFYSQKGASLGKMALGLQVSEAVTGKRLGYWRAFLRETVGKAISAIPFGIGFLLVAFRQDRLALHDMIFDTRVTKQVSK